MTKERFGADKNAVIFACQFHRLGKECGGTVEIQFVVPPGDRMGDTVMRIVSGRADDVLLRIEQPYRAQCLAILGQEMLKRRRRRLVRSDMKVKCFRHRNPSLPWRGR